jgi:mono/diheme cytochrome c family protein
VAVAFNGEEHSDDTVTVAGSSLFKTYCATCHGVDAKGDGPLADQLRVRPPDLTRFAHRNGGSFDKEKARRIIDGREPVKGHGGPDMPVWGDVFKRAEESYDEKKAQQRIESLVAYLSDIQRAQ